MLKTLAPRLLTALFKSLGILSLTLLQILGLCVGWLAWILPGRYKQRAWDNLRQAFPNATRATLRSAMLSNGQLMFEMPFWWTRRNEAFINTKLSCDNWTQFQVALEKGKGVILLSPHAGCFELLGPVYSSHFPSTVLFRPPRKLWMQDWIVEMRTRRQLKMAPANQKGVRALVKTLMRGNTIGILPDQVPPDGEGVWAPFFGRPAYTMTLVQRLQELSGATIFILAAQRNGIGKGYTLRHKELAEPLPNDPEAAALIINQEMEEMIRKMPEQYLWGYNRYKAPKNKAARVGAFSSAEGSTTK